MKRANIFFLIINLRGFNLDKAANNSILTTGGSSWTCSQPTGGDDGGEIRKALSFSGGCKDVLEFFNFIGLILSKKK